MGDRSAVESVERFFDGLSAGYDAAIERCVPRYREMLWALLHYVPDTLAPETILELGCGTGTLSALLARAYPDASLTLVDVSGGALEACRARLGPAPGIRFLRSDFAALDFGPGRFDLVCSSISIHHLDDPGKEELFRRVHRWLSPGGVFAYSDQVRAEEPDVYAKHLDLWDREARALGATGEEWARWMEHQDAHDHHAPLAAQCAWLRNAGFESADAVWRFLLWTVVQARRAP